MLLQTAYRIASDNLERQSVPIKVVLDSGAERTYITVFRKLKLKVNSSHNVLNTFGSRKSGWGIGGFERLFVVREKSIVVAICI